MFAVVAENMFDRSKDFVRTASQFCGVHANGSNHLDKLQTDEICIGNNFDSILFPFTPFLKLMTFFIAISYRDFKRKRKNLSFLLPKFALKYEMSVKKKKFPFLRRCKL